MPGVAKMTSSAHGWPTRRTSAHARCGAAVKGQQLRVSSHPRRRRPAVIFERFAFQEQRNRTDLRPVKKSVLLERYKHRTDVVAYVEEICTRLKKEGLTKPDPLAPNDEAELMYFLEESLVRKDEASGSKTRLQGREEAF
eukprot:6523202-Alexandrium_andersonii.AAC.1